MREQVFQSQDAIAFQGAPVAQRQQLCELSPAVPVLRISHNIRRAIGKDKPCAGGEAKLQLGQFRLHLTQGNPCPHHARDRVAIGNANAFEARQYRRFHHVGGVGGAAQKAVIGGRHHLDEIAHANRPWRYQTGFAASRP